MMRFTLFVLFAFASIMLGSSLDLYTATGGCTSNCRQTKTVYFCDGSDAGGCGQFAVTDCTFCGSTYFSCVDNGGISPPLCDSTSSTQYFVTYSGCSPLCDCTNMNSVEGSYMGVVTQTQTYRNTCQYSP